MSKPLDCKACANNQFCKFTDKEEVYKRLVENFRKDYDLGTPFDVEPTCEHFKNAFQGIPREIV